MQYNISKLAKLIVAKSTMENADLWLPLWMHAQDTAGIIEKLVNRWIAPSVRTALHLTDIEIKQTAVFIAMLHDIGKCTALFTNKITKYTPRIRDLLRQNGVSLDETFLDPLKSPHALVSQAILIDNLCPKGIASIVGSHHGKPPEISEIPEDQLEIYSYNCYGNQKTLWFNLWHDFLEMGKARAGITELTQLPALSQPAQVLFSGLLIMADWIASNTDYFPLINIETDFFQPNSIYPARVNEAWRKIDIPESCQPTSFTLDEEGFEQLFGFEPNAVQKDIIEMVNELSEPSVVILEAQMGSGKTEAALAAAQIFASRNGNGGIFLGLPTQATANGIFPRLIKWAEQQSETIKKSIKLAHGAATLNADYQDMVFKDNSNDDLNSNLYVHHWFEGNKKSLLADFVVGTVDQFLLAALKQKHIMLKHLGLVGKVVIIDEVHSYDPFMNKYLERMLSWLKEYGVSVILLSATLPENRRNSLLNAYLGKANTNKQENTSDYSYPLLSWIEKDMICHRTIQADGHKLIVNCQPLEDSNIISFLHKNFVNGGCVGIIVNTVKKAQLLGRQLTLEFPEHKIIVFHSQFDSIDRTNIEEKILKYLGKSSTSEQRNNLIVIGTQVLEQSLDIDFDLLLTDLCPMDLLLQRIGRLHRHPNRVRPTHLSEAKCAIFTIPDEKLESNLGSIYAKWLLKRTNMLLSDKISIPDDISKLIQETYREEFTPEELTPKLMSDLEQYKNDCKISYNKAEGNCIPLPKKSRTPTLDGWLDMNLSLKDLSDAMVRDSGPSVEVIPLQICDNNSLRFVSKQHQNVILRLTHLPSHEERALLLKHRLRLPFVLTHGGIIMQVIEELENHNKHLLPQWHRDKILSRELFLLFDSQNTHSLCGFNLSYSQQFGLTCTKEKENG